MYTPVAGQWISRQMCSDFAFAFSLQYRVIAVQGRKLETAVKTAVVLPAGRPLSVGLEAGICWTKVKSPRCSLGRGGRGYK